MGKHTGPVSGSSYSQCTQQLARCYLRLIWSWAPVYLLFVTAKCLDVTLVSEYRKAETAFFFFAFQFRFLASEKLLDS